MEILLMFRMTLALCIQKMSFIAIRGNGGVYYNTNYRFLPKYWYQNSLKFYEYLQLQLKTSIWAIFDLSSFRVCFIDLNYQIDLVSAFKDFYVQK